MKGVSVAFGIVMVLAAGFDGAAVALGVLAAALVAVVAGLFDRRAALFAVLLTIVALAIGAPTPLFTGVAGLAAAAYLLTGYAEVTGANTLTAPTLAGLIGFTLAGLGAAAITTKITWVPLLAPVVMTAVLVVVAIPLLSGDRTGPAGEADSMDRYE